jgi:acetyl esterase/lipase
MIFSGVDDLGDRLVVDAQIRRDAVQRRSLSVCRQDRRDDRYGLRGRTCIDQGLCDANKIQAAVAATGAGTLDHRVFENLWHDFHLQVSVLPEAREAVAELGAKLRDHVHGPSTTSDIHADDAKAAAQ